MRAPLVRSLACLVAASALAACGGKKADPFRTDTVTRGPVVEQVSATGDVEAIVTVNIGSQVSGTIARLFVDFNSLVKKNQVLAEIDPRLFRAQLERAEAGLASAKANVEKAQATLNDSVRQEKRTKELFDNKLVSQADLDTATATREANAAALSGVKALVLQAKADRDTAAVNLAFTKIVSPIDGIVVSRAVDVGQTVAASFQTPTMFTIANDLTKMQILANIDEADVGKVREGMDAKFTVDAWPGETFKGTIREVRQAPTTISNVVTYAAVIDAPNPQKKLRQGMTAQVQVTTGKRDDAVRVPNAALRFHPAGAPERGADKADKKDDKTLVSAGGERPTGERGAMRPEGMRGPRADGMRGDGAHGDGARGDGAHGEGEVGGRKVRLGRAYKLVDGKPVAVQLKLGLADSVRTEVLEGLAEGDVVITGEAGMPMGGPGAMGGMRPGGTAGAGPRRGF